MSLDRTSFLRRGVQGHPPDLATPFMGRLRVQFPWHAVGRRQRRKRPDVGRDHRVTNGRVQSQARS